METITISKKEYQALKRAQRELERSVRKTGAAAPRANALALGLRDAEARGALVRFLE